MIYCTETYSFSKGIIEQQIRDHDISEYIYPTSMGNSYIQIFAWLIASLIILHTLSSVSSFGNAFGLDPQGIFIKLGHAQFVPLSTSKGHQIKIVVNYTTNDTKNINNTINGVMKVYALNGTLLRTSSFPSGFKAQNVGTAQFATTLLDNGTKNVTTVIQMTNALKTIALSNSVKTRINLGQVEGSS